ncbi:hypothetical protein G9A89_011094 [Geosiphon pyriformis]|nr:hypothetical protein G9A89_011094 [Geosiphon pyriformis]
MGFSGSYSFRNAPVTKALILGVGGCSLAAHYFDLQPNLHLQLIPNLTVDHEFWRLITSHCSFTNAGEAVLGGMVLYNLRNIERQFGSAKYAAFILASSAISTLLELGALWAGRSYGLKFIPSGPYAIIFAGIYQYQRIIPATPLFTIFGLPISNNLIIYGLGLNLLSFRYPASSIAGICGLLASVLYQSNRFGFKRWRFPAFLNRFAEKFILPFLSSSSSSSSSSSRTIRRSNTVNLDDRHFHDRSGRRYGGVASPQALSPAAITDEQIATLQAMFPQSSQSHIAQAIRSANNDMNRAAQFLLDHPR